MIGPTQQRIRPHGNQLWTYMKFQYPLNRRATIRNTKVTIVFSLNWTTVQLPLSQIGFLSSSDGIRFTTFKFYIGNIRNVFHIPFAAYIDFALWWTQTAGSTLKAIFSFPFMRKKMSQKHGVGICESLQERGFKLFLQNCM